jgi:hypothetical protein
MPAAPLDPFQQDALDANRRGMLSDRQLRGFRAMSASNRRSALSTAALLAGGALLIGFFASPTAPIVTRTLLTFICLAIAVFLAVRAVTGADALTRDLRRNRVESVEGAIGKRRLAASGGPAATAYFLDVGEATFKVAAATYRAAPDAGFVRLYFLPRSRKIVNWERLANAPLPDEINAQGLLGSLAAAYLSRSRSQRNEARAGIASIADALDDSVKDSTTAPPPAARDPRPLETAIVGTWKSVLMTVTFSADGRVTTQMLDGKREGHWSVDDAGRLRADITGRPETADAWIVQNELTIAVDGAGLTFTRATTT